MARQFNQIPPICEQAEYHMFQREKVEVQLPELFHKIGVPKLIVLNHMNYPSMFDRQMSSSALENELITIIDPVKSVSLLSIYFLFPSVLRGGGHDMVATGVRDHLGEI